MTLVLILSFGTIQSQEDSRFPKLTPFGKLQLNVDTNRHIFLDLTPQIYGLSSSFLYKIGSDTMFCTKHNFAQVPTTTTIIIGKNFKSFLENEFIQGFNKVKIDPRHTPIQQSFVVSSVIFSGPLERWVFIRDEYYLTQINQLLVTFNSFLPAKEKFSLQFNKTIKDSPPMGHYIEIAIGDNQENTKNDSKRISLDLEKSLYTISFYDTIEKMSGINFNKNTLTTLKLATLKCVNSFSAEKTTLKLTGPCAKVATVCYTLPGIYILSKVKSLNKKTRNVYCDEYFKFLNSKLVEKYKLKY